MKAQVSKLSRNDLDAFILLMRVFETFFKMDRLSIPDDQHLLSLLDNPCFHVFTAIVDTRVVGGLTV